MLTYRALVSIWLVGVTVIAGLDAYAFYTDHEVFADAYALVFDNFHHVTVATFMAFCAVCAATATLVMGSQRELQPWVVPTLLVAYGSVVSTFGLAILESRDWAVTAATGGAKWLVFGLGCFLVAGFEVLWQRRPEDMRAMFKVLHDEGFRIVEDDRGVGHPFAAAMGVVAAGGFFILAVSETVVVALVAAVPATITAYVGFLAARRSAHQDNQKNRTDLVTMAREQAQEAEQERRAQRSRMLKIERQVDALRTVVRDLLDLVRAQDRDAAAVVRAEALLDEMAAEDA